MFKKFWNLIIQFYFIEINVSMCEEYCIGQSFDEGILINWGGGKTEVRSR